jgi:hypothetical protein
MKDEHAPCGALRLGQLEYNVVLRAFGRLRNGAEYEDEHQRGHGKNSFFHERFLSGVTGSFSQRHAPAEDDRYLYLAPGEMGARRPPAAAAQ